LLQFIAASDPVKFCRLQGIEADIDSFRARAGYKTGDSIASFIGRKIINYNNEIPPFWRYNKTDNQLIFSFWHVSEKTIDSYIDKLIQFKPKFIHGYPSFITLIAEYVFNKNIIIDSVKAIFTSSENLLDYQRAIIEKAFNAKVFDRYGSAEMVVSASQCEYGKYHVNPMLGYMEIINNRIVGTTFHNYAMPLIRYDIGDMCTKGVQWGYIKKINGRNVSIFKTKTGNLIDGEYFTHLFYMKDWVKKFQVVQNDYENLTIKIVLNNKKGKISDILSIERNIKLVMGQNCRIKCNFVKRINQLKSGKYLYTISKVK